MTDPYQIFRETMAGLDAGLRVRHIASFELKTCDATAATVETLQSAELANYHHIPVVSDGRIIGVLERDRADATGRVRDNMRPLDDSLLVSADEPLSSFVSCMLESPYRLVVDRSGIQGIVTRSDVHKLPVRILTFCMITQLEMTMAAYVSKRRPKDESWMKLLSAGRRGELHKNRSQLAERGLDPPMIELTQFCDKRDLVGKLLHGTPGFSHKKFDDEMDGLIELRDLVAHAQRYADNDDQFRLFVERIQTVQRWIAYLSRRLSENDGNGGHDGNDGIDGIEES